MAAYSGRGPERKPEAQEPATGVAHRPLPRRPEPPRSFPHAGMPLGHRPLTGMPVPKITPEERPVNGVTPLRKGCVTIPISSRGRSVI